GREEVGSTKLKQAAFGGKVERHVSWRDESASGQQLDRTRICALRAELESRLRTALADYDSHRKAHKGGQSLSIPSCSIRTTWISSRPERSHSISRASVTLIALLTFVFSVPRADHFMPRLSVWLHSLGGRRQSS